MNNANRNIFQNPGVGLGIIYLIMGVIYDNVGIIYLGAVLLIIGVGINKRFSERKYWSELNEKEKRNRIWLIGSLSFFTAILTIAIIFYRSLI